MLTLMQEIISLCESRCVLFDNKTKDKKKQFKQVKELISLENMIVVVPQNLTFHFYLVIQPLT